MAFIFGPEKNPLSFSDRLEARADAVAPTDGVPAPAISPASLFGQVLLIDAVGFGITAFSAKLFAGVANTPGLWLSVWPLALGVVWTMRLLRENESACLLLLYFLTFIEGIAVVQWIGPFVGPQAVVNAALTTALGIFALGAIVYATGLDYRRLASIVAGAVAFCAVPLIVLYILLYMVHPHAAGWWAVLLFSAALTIDFARVRAGGGGLTAVECATRIYMDALGIFVFLTGALNQKRTID